MPAPSRQLPPHPDLDQLRRQAKELLAGWRQGDPNAADEVRTYYRDAERDAFALHDAQLVLARAYGFESWPKLKAFVDGASVRRLADAVLAGDEAAVAGILQTRPELVHCEMAANDEHRAIHFAVLHRMPGMVRLLMRHGADARRGIFPHRLATTAHILADERGYGEIVTIIEEEEARRQLRDGNTGRAAEDSVAAVNAVSDALAQGDAGAALEILKSQPSLATATNRGGWTLLHVAAAMRAEAVLEWLLVHGADPNAVGPLGRTPLDNVIGRGWKGVGDQERVSELAGILRKHGAKLTARAAVALGDIGWLHARHALGTLENPVEDWGGLLTVAVIYNRPSMLAQLLEFGFDPNERIRVGDLEERIFSEGFPLWHAAVQGSHAIAEILLAHGADPNANVYASGTPTFQAHGRRDARMLEILERHGGLLNPDALGHHRETARAAAMFAEADAGRFPPGFDTMESLAAEMLWSAACGGDPEIVAMCLVRLDWPEGDSRWFWPLQQPLRLWNHMGGFWDKPDFDRGTYLPCFQQILERAGANVVGRNGLTILHDVAALRDYVTPNERVAFASELLRRDANLTARDDLLKSSPLGWACRWGRAELVMLLLAHRADPVEADAEPWATPLAWARKRKHAEIEATLLEAGAERR